MYLSSPYSAHPGRGTAWKRWPKNSLPPLRPRLPAAAAGYPTCSRNNQRKNVPITIGSWNIRTLLDNDNLPRRRTAVVAHELLRYNIDICALAETRFHGEDSLEETGEGYTFFWKGVEPGNIRQHGVGFAIKTALLRNMGETPVGINERLMTWRIPLVKGRYATLVSAYAPTLAANADTKEAFYDTLNLTLDRIPKQDKILLLGDFNARVGTDRNIWPGIIGRHGTGKCNSNGTRLLTLCAQHNLTITNTLFQLKNRYKVSWKHPRSAQWHLLDYCITRQADRNDILITRAMRGAECSTDHVLIRSKVRLCIRPPMRRSAPARILDCNSLTNPEVKTKLRQNLAAELEAHPEEDMNVEDSWNMLKTSICKASASALGYRKRRNQDWFDSNATGIHKLLEEKKAAHDAHLSCPQSADLKEKFLSLKRSLQLRLRQMENDWWLNKAAEIQEYSDSNNSYHFYEAVKTIYGPQRKNLAPVKSSDGTLIRDNIQIAARWTEHFTSLLNHRNPIQPDFIENLQPKPTIVALDTFPSFSEVTRAIKHLKNRKSAGIDNIPPEIIKEGGYLLKRRLFKLITQIWEEEVVPQDLKDAVIVTIYKKKGDRADCGNSRGIFLLSIAGKVIASIMLQRLLTQLTETIIPASQYGFRKDRSTTDAIFIARQLQEKCREERKDLYMAFIDLRKAFDTVNRETMWQVLEKFGVPPKFLAILRQLHDGMQARVRVGNVLSEPFPVAVGVKQGCVLAPILFNIFLAAISIITHNVINGYKGVEVEYRLDGNLFNLRRLQAHTKTTVTDITELQYADDLVLLANTPMDLQNGLDLLTAAYDSMGLKVNINKTEIVMQNNSNLEDIQHNPPHFHIDNEEVKVVEDFPYLGSILSASCSIEAEINARINKASVAYGRLNQRVFNNRNLKVTTRAAVYRAVCVSTLLYGAETWTLYTRHIRKLESFHMQCLRRIAGLTWQDHIPYDSIYERTNSTSITSMLARRHLTWVGHVIRMSDDRLPRQILYGQLHQGNRPPGGQKKRYKDQCKDLLKQCQLQPTALETLANDRVKWRRSVHEGAKLIESKLSTKRADNRTKRAQRAEGVPVGSQHLPCPTCGKICGSRIGLHSHLQWHQRRER